MRPTPTMDPPESQAVNVKPAPQDGGDRTERQRALTPTDMTGASEVVPSTLGSPSGDLGVQPVEAQTEPAEVESALLSPVGDTGLAQPEGDSPDSRILSPSCRNLSTSSGNTGQDAAPAGPARLTVESLIKVLDMLRRLDERAKADVRAPTHPTRADADADPAPDRAGGAGNHRSLGGTPGDRQAFSQETVSET